PALRSPGAPVLPRSRLPGPGRVSSAPSHFLIASAICPQQHRALERLERLGAVAGAPRGAPPPPRPGEPPRGHHVARHPRGHVDGGPLVSGEVPRLARLVITEVTGDEDLTADGGPQCFGGAVGDGGRGIHGFLISLAVRV